MTLTQKSVFGIEHDNDGDKMVCVQIYIYDIKSKLCVKSHSLYKT